MGTLIFNIPKQLFEQKINDFSASKWERQWEQANLVNAFNVPSAA